MNLVQAKRKIEVLLEVKAKIDEADKLICELFNFDRGHLFDLINTERPFYIRYTRADSTGHSKFYTLIFNGVDDSLDQRLNDIIGSGLIDDLIEIDEENLLNWVKGIIDAFEGMRSSTEYKSMCDKYYHIIGYNKYPIYYEKALNATVDRFFKYLANFFTKIREGRPISHEDGTGSVINRDGWSSADILDFVEEWTSVLDDTNSEKYQFLLEYEQSKETKLEN